jgi:hypothetical protein
MSDDNTKTGTIAPRMDRFHEYMLQRAGIDTNRSVEVMAQQAAKIMAAADTGDADAIWNADMGGTIQMRDVAGTEWEIRSYEPVISNRTDLDNTNGYYVSCDATLMGGPEDVLTKNGLVIGQDYALQTGAELVMRKLRALEANGMLPTEAMVIGLTTASGNTVIKLGRPPKRAVKGKSE